MNHFEYVMVLISIIIGLGIAHILLGIGGIVDRLTGRGERLRLSVAHGAWLAHTFFWLVLFWVVTYWLATITISALGIRVPSIRYHATAGVALLLLDFTTSVAALPRLGF